MKKWFKKHKKALMCGAGAAGLTILGLVLMSKKDEYDDNPMNHRKLFIPYALAEGEYGDEDPTGEKMPSIYALVDNSKTENFLACKDNLIQTAHDNDMTIRFSTNWNDTKE